MDIFLAGEDGKKALYLLLKNVPFTERLKERKLRFHSNLGEKIDNKVIGILEEEGGGGGKKRT